MLSESQKIWIQNLNNQIPAYLQRLMSLFQVGWFLPCETGATELGKRLALGYSCFALKTYYMLGMWDGLETDKQAEWLQFIKSYQVNGPYAGDVLATNAFVDPPLVDFHQPSYSLRQRIAEYFKPLKDTYQRAVIFAETKQALATLMEVGNKPDLLFTGFKQTPEKLHAFLSSLDWTKPWGAGGQASAHVVFVKTQAPLVLGESKAHELLQVCDQWFESFADPSTGLYFSGNIPPEHGQAINGAMKVLTALDWLDTPVHYPERLMDTCLSRLPSPEGCHLVDAMYVLYRCLEQTDYKRKEAQQYCAQVLEMIMKHHNADGGFSYFIGKSQTNYYGAPITKGLPESDIHGTILLTWAIAMILDMQENNFLQWKVIKP